MAANLVQQLFEFLNERPVPAESLDELVGDFRDFTRTINAQDRPYASKREAAAPQSPRLPKELADRQRSWSDARLNALTPLVREARLSLGFSQAPFTDDIDLAKEIWYWLTTPNPRHYVTSPDSPAVRLGDAVKQLLPRAWPALPGKTDQESQWAANRTTLRNFEHNARLVGEHAGVDAEAAAVWILSDVKPTLECMYVSISARFRGPTVVTMRINPDVVKPEEVGTLYRQIRQKGSSSDRRLREFALEDGVPLREWDSDRLRRWNERYPLRRFKNVESARVAASRAQRRTPKRSPDNRILRGKIKVVDKDRRERTVDATFVVDDVPNLELFPALKIR